jgi:hypothetical protein
MANTIFVETLKNIIRRIYPNVELELDTAATGP